MNGPVPGCTVKFVFQQICVGVLQQVGVESSMSARYRSRSRKKSAERETFQKSERGGYAGQWEIEYSVVTDARVNGTTHTHTQVAGFITKNWNH